MNENDPLLQEIPLCSTINDIDLVNLSVAQKNTQDPLKNCIGTEIKDSSKSSVQHPEIDPETWKMITGIDKKIPALDILARIYINPAIPGTDAAEFIIPVMEELNPQNLIEGMLYSQLLSLHCLGMDYLKRAEQSKMLNQRDSAVNHAVKLLRLQHETIDTLIKHKRKGEQKIVVQHVNVSDGGQAIVGNVLNTM